MTLKEKKANLESLWRGIEVQAKVTRGLELLESLPEAELKVLLRHHSERKVPWREVDQRDCIDRVLGAVSQFAVATVAGYVPAKWDGTLAKRIGQLLSGDALRTYYEIHYKLFLPTLMRLACADGLQLPQEDTRESWGAFQWFWRTSMRFQDDTDLWSFLWLLDGGSFGDFGLAQFHEGVADPRAALAGVGKPADLRSPLETSTIGMVRFFEFSKELGDGLAQLEDQPLTASAIWFHYAYWYKEFAQMEAQIEQLLSVMKSWVDAAPVGVRGLREAEEDMERLRLRIQELTSGRYSKALVDAINLKV